MIARWRSRSRLVMALVLLPLVAGLASAQNSWEDVFRASQRIQMESWGGIGSGEVSDGFAAFALDLDYVGPLTIEVSVTAHRQGREYDDDDSRLFLYDSQGYLIAENDDSEFGGYQSLINGVAIDSPGRYYAVVTTYPNSPEMDSSGRFSNLPNDGGSNISFDLIVEYGIREGGGSYDDEPMWEDMETSIWFEDFPSLSTPVRYAGGEVVREGYVDEGVTLFHLTVAEETWASIEVRPEDGEYGDTTLSIIDSLGNVVAEDDDGGIDGGSLVYEVYLDPMEDYYVAVAGYPNWPNYDEFGFVEGYALRGESFVNFQLIIGPPREGAYYGSAETSIWFEDFWQLATPIHYTGGELIQEGSVDNGVTLYRLTVSEETWASVDVHALPGQYSDTTLTIIDSSGNLIAQDDDSGGDGGSLVWEVYLEPGEEYYVAVASYPNWPNYDEGGFVEGYPEIGEGYMEFQLTIGPPREGEYYGDEPYWEELETAIWFDEFDALATPARYRGSDLVFEGDVADGVALYHLTSDEPAYVSITARGRFGGEGDTTLTVIDAEGYIVSEDDDGAGMGGSLVYEILIDDPRGYYVAVATYPNWANRDDRGYVEGFPLGGQGYVEYELIIGEPVPYDDGPYDGYDGSGIGPDGGFGAYGIEEVGMYASYISLRNGRGRGSGEVGTGFSAFSFEIREPSAVTIEVVVTEVRQGTSYADSDSVLTLFGADGLWYASDDDGGMDGASLIEGVWLSQPGTYYAIVTTFPNEPTSSSGFFEYVDPVGESNIAFDLVISTEQAQQ